MNTPKSFALGSTVGTVDLVLEPHLWQDLYTALPKIIVVAFISGICGVLGKMVIEWIIDLIKTNIHRIL